MQWHDSKRSFLSVMKAGTNLIYSFLSRKTKNLAHRRAVRFQLKVYEWE